MDSSVGYPVNQRQFDTTEFKKKIIIIISELPLQQLY